VTPDTILRWYRKLIAKKYDGTSPAEGRPARHGHFAATPGRPVAHYHLERNHQGLDNRLITAAATPANENADPAGPIARRERLGGLLSHYYRLAA
jgi:hypothetical protein